MTTVIYYHGNCPDGFGAALAAWLFLGDSATYHEIHHGGKELNLEPLIGANVYFLDFCPKPDIVTAVCKVAKWVVVLDHHKSAIDDFNNPPFPKNSNLELWFDTNHSGAWLAADYFRVCEDDRVPLLFDYIEDRDLWKWALPNSREVAAALWAQPRTFDAWSKHLNSVNKLTEQGSSILQYQQTLIEQIASQMVVREDSLFPDGTKLLMPVVNATVLFSDVCDFLLKKHPEYPAALYYFDRADGKRQWGSRSRPGTDISVLAKKYGGGGHPQAAGWQSAVGWLPGDKSCK